MKYITLVFFFLQFFEQSYTQDIHFRIADPQPVLQEVYGGSLLSGDFDNDGDVDIVQSGIGLDIMGLGAKASVFLNDGNGNFSLREQNFNDYWSTEELALGDFDNDGNLDLIITAENRSDLYLNDGLGNFIFENDSILEPISFSQVIVGDVNGDGSIDVLQYGEPNTTQFPPVANLYFNTGEGEFEQSQNTVFEPLRQATSKFIDLEGDGDLDVLSFGNNTSNEPQVGVYENDGFGNYTIFANSMIAPHVSDEISVGDIDNDGDEDVLITGSDATGTPKTILYLNDGSGQFTELMNTPFPALFAGTNAFADIDNDDDLDILLIGSMDGGIPNIFSIVYENFGDNNFVATDSLGGEYIAESTIADFNGDGKKDIIIQGFVDDTNVYWNETVLSNTKEVSDHTFIVSPNPSSGQIQVTSKEGAFDRIEILDQHGRLITRKSIDGQKLQNFELDMPSGVYILKMSGVYGISSQKIVLIK